MTQIAPPSPARRPASATHADDTTPHHVGVLIIGAGFSGLGAAISLQKDGHTDFLVLERGNNVGGTWRVNTYPGAACDVPSHLYSYSFAPNRNWTRSYSKQPEIEAYIQQVARQHQVLDRHRFGCEVHEVRWNAQEARWRVNTSQGSFTANFVVSAVGPLTEPALPDIDGLDEFEGEIFHSARWNHDFDLTGKRVAVIGTGASAIQIVPELAKNVRQLDVYQRTAPWVLPRFDRDYTTAERFAFARVPGYQRLVRSAMYWSKELIGFALTYAPENAWAGAETRQAPYRARDRRSPASRQSHPSLADRLQAHADVEHLLPGTGTTARRCRHRLHRRGAAERHRHRRWQRS